jgi:hypothetical protein
VTRWTKDGVMELEVCNVVGKRKKEGIIIETNKFTGGPSVSVQSQNHTGEHNGGGGRKD